MKKYLIFLLLVLLFLTGCSKLKGLQYEKIEASHVVYDEDVSSYFLLYGKPVLENNSIGLKYSITIYSNIKTGNSRYFNYYQVDWTTDTNYIDQYYHIFVEDARKRSYAQNFFPYNYIEGNRIKTIDVMFDYEYVIDEIKTITKATYSEEIMNISKNDLDDLKFVEELQNYDIKLLGEKRPEEDFNRFKLNIGFIDLNEISHIDFQSWIVTKDQEIYPFFGIYHYQLTNVDFISVSDETVSDAISCDELYCQIKYYYSDQMVEVFYRTKIVIGEEL